MRIRRIVKTAIYALLALIVVLAVFFAVRGIVRARSGKKTEADASSGKSTAESVVSGSGKSTADSTEAVSPEGESAGSTVSASPVAPSVSTSPASGKDTAVQRMMAQSGEGAPGWNVDENGWWYKSEDNSRYADGWQTIGGERYYFNADGYLATGWQNIDGKYIFFRESGVQDPKAHLKCVALTFDDGPSPNTDRILKVLADNDAKATFFVVGTMAEIRQEQIRAEHEAGMQIGSHTYDHDYLTKLDPDGIKETMDKLDDVVRSVTGEGTTVMRPPGGLYNDTVQATLDKPMIIWDVDTLDWKTRDAESTYNAVMNEVKDGSIILMHDLYEATAEAAERIIPALAEMGYKMVTVSELAQINGYTLQAGEPYLALYPQGGGVEDVGETAPASSSASSGTMGPVEEAEEQAP